LITLDDGNKTKTFDDFGFYAQWSHKKPRSGSLSHKTQHIPQQIGDWYFGTQIGSKSYSLNLIAWERDWNKFETLADELNAFFFDNEGNPKLIKVTWSNSKKFMYMMISTSITPNVDSVIEKIPLEFVAYDPHEYSTSSAYDLETPLRYDEGHQYGEKGYANTTGFDWIYSRHYSGLENYSSLNTDIKMTIKGTVKGGSVTHLESGVKLTFPDVTNGTVVIDGSVFNVQVNGVDTVFDGEFPVLCPGGNGFLFEAETVNATVSFDWYHKFM